MTILHVNCDEIVLFSLMYMNEIGSPWIDLCPNGVKGRLTIQELQIIHYIVQSTPIYHLLQWIDYDGMDVMANIDGV